MTARLALVGAGHHARVNQPDIVAAVLAAGRNVLCEKPLGTDAAQARRLADLAADAGVVLRVGFMKRHAPALVALRDLARSGRFGPPLGFDVRFAADARAFAPDVRSFLTLAAVHHVDLVPFLLGAPHTVPVAVATHASGSTLSALLTVAPQVHGTLRLASLPAHSSEVDVVEVAFEQAVVKERRRPRRERRQLSAVSDRRTWWPANPPPSGG